jgi:hypothetical protein
MKKVSLAALAFVLGSFLVMAGSSRAGWVDGYYRSNGTYVPGHYRSDANGLGYDNYSYKSGDSLYNNSYNDSYRSNNWRRPAWETQNDYWTGYHSYHSRW